MKLVPDWSLSPRSATQIEHYIGNGFKFLGPGWYLLAEGQAILVAPQANRPNGSDPFAGKWPKETKFHLHCWSESPVRDFALAASAPTRRDERKRPDPGTEEGYDYCPNCKERSTLTRNRGEGKHLICLQCDKCIYCGAVVADKPDPDEPTPTFIWKANGCAPGEPYKEVPREAAVESLGLKEVERMERVALADFTASAYHLAAGCDWECTVSYGGY